MALSHSEDDMCMSSGMYDTQQQRRIKRKCPLPGCERRPPLARLSNYIREYHKIESEHERQKWLAKAKTNVSILQII